MSNRYLRCFWSSIQQGLDCDGETAVALALPQTAISCCYLSLRGAMDSSSSAKAKHSQALVPIECLEQMRRFARRHALDVMEQQNSGTLNEIRR